jgi:hypothetical protein
VPADRRPEDVEYFVHDRWDLPERARAFDELGVRSQPTDASKLVDRLRALSQLDAPPIGHLRDLYRAVERILPRLPEDRRKTVLQAFAAEALIRSESDWERSAFCFRENPGGDRERDHGTVRGRRRTCGTSGDEQIGQAE